MKRALLLGALLLCLGISGRAWALLSGSYINAVTKLNSETCAVEITPSGGLLDILPLDQVTVEGNLLATLAAILDLNLDRVEHILVATPSFGETVGVDVDVEIDPEECLKLLAGDRLDLVGYGRGVLDSVTLPEEFGDLTALLIDADGNLHLLNLLDETAPVTNAGGTDSSVGGGASGVGEAPGGDETGAADGPVVGALPNEAAAGGCGLNPGWGAGITDLLGLALAAGFLLIRKQRT